MKIRRYIGNTTQEAMGKLRKELGSDAIILHTRKIKKPGVFGMLQKSLIEIVAAVDEEKKIENTKIQPKNGYNNSIKPSEKLITKDNFKKTYGSFPQENTERKYSNYTNEKTSDISKLINKEIIKNPSIVQSNSNEEINNEIKKLRGTMEGFMKSFESKLHKNFNLPDKLRYYKEVLINHGVNEIVANSILGNIDKHVNLDDKTDDEIKEIVRFNVTGYLGNPSPIRYNGQQKIVFFIGPTGVGKTTTLAKLAAYYTLEKKLDVGLITADTYRIAAVEQLKIYSDILNIPIKIIYEKKDFYEVLSNFKDKDIVFVDTAGRNHKDEEQMGEIKELLEVVKHKEIYLVLSSTTDLEGIKEILKQYEFVDDYKIIFTKIDEASSNGVILNTKFYTQNPLSYFTTGQNVPEDIEIANITKVGNQLIGESKDERSS